MVEFNDESGYVQEHVTSFLQDVIPTMKSAATAVKTNFFMSNFLIRRQFYGKRTNKQPELYFFLFDLTNTALILLAQF